MNNDGIKTIYTKTDPAEKQNIDQQNRDSFGHAHLVHFIDHWMQQVCDKGRDYEWCEKFP